MAKQKAAYDLADSKGHAFHLAEDAFWKGHKVYKRYFSCLDPTAYWQQFAGKNVCHYEMFRAGRPFKAHVDAECTLSSDFNHTDMELAMKILWGFNLVFGKVGLPPCTMDDFA